MIMFCARNRIWFLLVVTIIGTGCTPIQLAVTTQAVPQQVKTVPLTALSPCTGTFIAHNLDHVTTIEGEVVRLFESNGAGLAINDLDLDGDLDIVFANLAGPNAIFWNQGDLRFRKEAFPHGDSRGVAIIDVDGDGWQDIVFTRRLTVPTYWRNILADQNSADEFGFVEQHLAGFAKPAYTMAWGDLDHDGDLDAVTASYDLALKMVLGDSFRFGEGAGIRYYEQVNRESDSVAFASHFLARRAESLALLLADLNDDGWQDILVGNDFIHPDQIWLFSPTGWQETQLFAATTQNTMSFALGDIDNNGLLELFAADMKPYRNDDATLAAWQPVMDKVERLPNDPQTVANMLQMRNASGHFINRAVEMELSATGWSWSAKFGDLDNDGFLDLYVVNGMVALDLFDHLPGNELVEENQALRNLGASRFTPAPAWGLNSTLSGRGMSMADLDADGDLDIVVNNLLRPAQIFENQVCGGSALLVDLFWPDSKNTRALGAKVVLQTSTERHK